MRFLTRRRIFAALSLTVLVVLALIGGLIVYISSPAFEERARQYIVTQIEQRTGARVSLKAFSWSFRNQQFRIQDLTLRGLEPPEEAPLAHIDRIDIGLNFRTLLERHIDLFELIISRPEFHVTIGADGRTNIPSPEERGERKPFNFQISIQNFKIADGMALLNERPINIDFSLANLNGALNYQSAREVLTAQINYDGIFDRSADGKPSIPYALAADVDYTRATIVARQIVVQSEKSQVKLQGKVTDVLNKNISGKLEYTGNVQVPFLNYFFTKERFGGAADVAGFLEFSPGYFFTQGNTSSEGVDYEGWHASKLTGEYAYHYPGKRLSFRKIKTGLVDGGVSGNVVVENLPGPSRVLLDLDYAGVDGAKLARAYPWDPKYRIFSKLTGTLDGWFEGKLARYDFYGHANMAAYTPADATGLVALPLDGSTDFRVTPGQANVTNADARFYSTSVQADGLIHGKSSDLALALTSSDLRDLAFLYSDAAGSGTFSGVLTGPISKPALTGDFSLENHKLREWTIQRAEGGVRIDTALENVEFRNARVTQGQSTATVSGTIALSGSPADLRVQSDRVLGADIRQFVGRDIDGVFSGNIHITSISPVRLEGDLRADNSSLDGRALGDMRGHVRYFDPVVDATQLSIKRGQATATGDVTLNRSTDAVKFDARVTNVDLSTFTPLGLPQSVKGLISQAEVHGDGTTKRPNVQGEGQFQDLSIYSETFPQAHVTLSSMGSRLDVTLSTGSNVDLTAQIDTATVGYPFTARATFTQYSLERLASLKQGTIVATGRADLSGSLTDRSLFRGQGQIESAEAVIEQQTLRTMKPFSFNFNTDNLTVTDVTLTGLSTQVNLAGTIGLTERAPLNLSVMGRVDLTLISAAYPEWFSNGSMNIDGQIRGTAQNPDLRGVAHLTNASLGRRGFFTTLSKLNGDLFFDLDRITLNNVEGTMGGGTIRSQGVALLRGGEVQDMNIRLDAENVRVRYPEGLRTVINGGLVVRGAWQSPLLEGNVQIQNLSYRSSFEDFLTLLTEQERPAVTSPLGRLRLALHVQGSRNITIENQLASVEARVEIDLKGTVDNPLLTGHLEASGGTLTFQGNRYRVTRGNIDFVDALHIEPVVDVQAESEVRDYRIILAISGRGSQLHLDMRSDPPLPELEIVSLIAGGKTREEEYSARAPGSNVNVPTSEQLFQSGAASILFDLLQQRVGNRLGLFGIDRVRIDPYVLGAASNNPGARITLSEQVTKDLSITYSQDLSSNRQQIILIEYFVNRNTSILASRDELGNFGLDLRLRKRF